VDWLVIGFVAAQAIVIAIVLAQAIARGRSLDEIRETRGLTSQTPKEPPG